jgi:hypothetical protein
METGDLKIKTCKKCLKEKEASEFTKYASSSDGLNSQCKSCRNPWVKSYRDKNREKITAQKEAWNSCRPGARKDYVLKKNYGISLEEFNQKWASQNQTCALCKNSPRNTKDMHVDHDHTTGKVRGILCQKCNVTKVGSNTVESVQQILDYLLKYG